MKISKEELMGRVIAKGEHSNHSHIVVGNATVTREGEDIFIEAHDDSVTIRHLLETDWLNGTQTWTGEHADIQVKKGKYKYIPQTEYNPLNAEIQRTKD